MRWSERESVTITFDVEDVYKVAPDLQDFQAREVLAYALNTYNKRRGLNYNVLFNTVTALYPSATMEKKHED